MTLLDVVVVALVQGLAEVLPLGASGHLALLPSALAGAPDELAAVLLAAHGGILIALALYFWRDMGGMGLGLWKLAKGRPDAGTRLFFRLLVGTVPAAAIGWGIGRLGLPELGPIAVAAILALFGLFLLVADNLGMTVRRVDHLSFLGAFVIGLVQAVAIIPGVSRTGITITVARLMGFERDEAVRFSLLLSIPLLAGSVALSAWALWHRAALAFSSDLAVAGALAAGAGLIAAAAMIGWVRHHSFAPFALWRILLGGGVLVWTVWG